MKFWICPKANCNCINPQSNTKCDGCGLPQEGALLFPNTQWLEFGSITDLDKWISNMKRNLEKNY